MKILDLQNQVHRLGLGGVVTGDLFYFILLILLL